jgi:hypothetical protein
MTSPSHKEVRDFFLKTGFKPITKESYPLFRDFEKDSILIERAALVAVSWSSEHNGLYTLLHGCLCCVLFYERKPVYFVIYQPAVDMSAAALLREDALRAVIDDLYQLSQEIRLPFLEIRYIDEECLGEYEKVSGYTVQTNYSDNDSEYLLRTGDFLDLKGNVNRQKRKRINKILKEAEFELRSLTNENIRICLDIESEWCCGRDCRKCIQANGCERRAVEIMVDIFDEKTHCGHLLYQGDKPIGYSVVEKRNQKSAFGYFGKSLQDDSFVYIMYMTAEQYMPDVEYFNIDADLGIPGLRMFKQHLGPFELKRKYICAFTKSGEKE